MRLGAAFGVLLIAVGAVAGCDSDDNTDARTCRLVTPPSPVSTPAASGVKVTEQGYTTVAPDLVQNSTSFPRVSIGAVLENTSDQVA